MYDLPSQDNIEEVIVDASAVKGQSQPILVHSKMIVNQKITKHQRLNIIITLKKLLQYLI